MSLTSYRAAPPRVTLASSRVGPPRAAGVGGRRGVFLFFGGRGVGFLFGLKNWGDLS